ncbi:MAG: MBL fold metallo-hydrolase [Phycisphaerales bacterium]|nr:MBL fold metallo-hydrolase [Phycisphaerales bacterium]
MANPGWNWKLLRCGEFRLDGGSMFGIVPKALWAKAANPDEKNRIRLQTNALLLEREGRVVVVEVGNGDKFGPKERDIYAMEDRSILDALHEADCRPEDVSDVIVTHLHFDHAGGLTRLPRAGEPDGPRLTFPNARIVSQQQEWDDALANRSSMTRTYLREHLTSEVAERLHLVESAPPLLLHGPGRAPEPSPAGAGTFFDFVEVLPGIDVFRVPGHTWGQQAVRVRAIGGETVVFTPDVMPTVHHLGGPYNMAYDVEPYVSGLMRHKYLEAAASEGWILAIDHEPDTPLVRVVAEPGKPGVWRPHAL